MRRLLVQTDQILDHKGREVATVPPDAPVRAAVEQLQQANVGALVVSADGTSVDGIVSERDVVRHLAADGRDILDRPVADIMQSQVHTCSGSDNVDDLMHRMTEHRIRHLPVVDDGGQLTGIISIGDVVKTHVDALETEREQLVDYIRTGR
jgi:CBS domain-containing protein